MYKLLKKVKKKIKSFFFKCIYTKPHCVRENAFTNLHIAICFYFVNNTQCADLIATTITQLIVLERMQHANLNSEW